MSTFEIPFGCVIYNNLIHLFITCACCLVRKKETILTNYDQFTTDLTIVNTHALKTHI